MILVESLRTRGQVRRPRSRSASGSFEFVGSGALTAPAAGLSASGSFEFTGTGAMIGTPQFLSASGSFEFDGAGVMSTNPSFLSASGSFEFVGRGALGQFTPDQLTGLQLWLDAADASTLYDATTGGSLVAADGAVARWEDKSGNARHATQGTSGARPLRKTAVQNGADVLRFDGGDDGMDVAHATGLNLAAGGTVVYVVKKSGGFRVLQKTSSLTGDATGTGVTGDGYLANDSTVLSVAAAFTTSFATNEDATKIFAGVWDGSVISFYRDGAQLTPTNVENGTIVGATIEPTSTINNNTDKLTIAYREASGGSGWVLGDIAEILIYNRALDATERRQVEEYLQAKWATPALP